MVKKKHSPQPMTKKKPSPQEPDSSEQQGTWKLVRLGLVLLVVGLALAVSSGAYRWHLSDKADRLRVTGQEVAAQITDSYLGSGRGSGMDTITLVYEYEGRSYHATIRCGGFTGCATEPEGELIIWVDPEHPDEFVAENGNTDDSVTFLNSWTLIPAGIFFAILGVVSLVCAVIIRRQDRPLREARLTDR